MGQTQTRWEAELGLWEASLQLLVCMVLGPFMLLTRRVFVSLVFLRVSQAPCFKSGQLQTQTMFFPCTGWAMVLVSIPATGQLSGTPEMSTPPGLQQSKPAGPTLVLLQRSVPMLDPCWGLKGTVGRGSVCRTVAGVRADWHKVWRMEEWPGVSLRLPRVTRKARS